MPSLRYLGPPAAAATDILTSATTDAGFTAGVSLDRLNEKVTTATAGLVEASYVDTQDGLLVTKSYIDSQDGLNVLTSSIGAANGVAPLDANGKIPTSDIPAGAFVTPKIKGPYNFSWTSGSVPEAYYDGSGRWDQFMGSITIPAPGGSGLWRPVIFGHFEVYNITGGRTDIFVTGAGYELARACGRNSTVLTQSYPVTIVPRSDTNAQTSGGWAANVGMTLNFYVSEVFTGHRGAVVQNGEYSACAFVMRIS